MRTYLLPFLLLGASPWAQAQQVIATTGQTHTIGSLIVSQTVGEAITGTLTNGISVEQGFHNYDITITTVHAENSTIQARVYPNPFTEIVQIEGSEAIGNIELFNMAGHLVLANSPARDKRITTLDLSQLVSGQYLLRVRSGDGRSFNTYNIVKQ